MCLCYVNIRICIYICLYVRECVYLYIFMYISVFSFDLFILMLLLLFFSRSPFSFIFVLAWGTTMKIRRFWPFCFPSHSLCYYHICLQEYFKFNFYILNFNHFVCLFVCLFVCFLLGCYLHLTNFIIFQALHSFLWLVFMVT